VQGSRWGGPGTGLVSHDDRLRDQTDNEQAGQPQEQAKRENT